MHVKIIQEFQMAETVKAEASPSLALIKYWGKADDKKNIPATSSLALTLDSIKTSTTIKKTEGADCVIIDGSEQPAERFKPFFDNFRKISGSSCCFLCKSRNNFPTAAGFASSASGFAALALGLRELCNPRLTDSQVSAAARIGSASASRAVFGGAVILRKGAEYAEPVDCPPYWKDVRILAVQVSEQKKEISSRTAMNNSRETSPFYEGWVRDSEDIFKKALSAFTKSDLDSLGRLMRFSYLRMFSTMFSSDPPLVFWQPESLMIIKICEQLRKDGLSAWETMDAGPQVKILCMKDDASDIIKEIGTRLPGVIITEDRIGSGPLVTSH
jgi:diphosphomevalonate decarboxylase